MKSITRRVRLDGIKPIMFDRYAGDNNTKLQVYDKLYLRQEEGGLPIIGIPSANIMSFLSAVNTTSAPKRLMDVRKYKAVAQAALTCVEIEHNFLPFLRDGAPIRFGQFDEETEVDPVSRVYIHRSSARLDKGVPNPKIRPVVPLDWALEFNLTLIDNPDLKEEQLRHLFDDGGLAVGLGTYRGVFGKFELSSWA